jgi:hypothetical protein
MGRGSPASSRLGLPAGAHHTNIVLSRFADRMEIGDHIPDIVSVLGWLKSSSPLLVQIDPLISVRWPVPLNMIRVEEVRQQFSSIDNSWSRTSKI